MHFLVATGRLVGRHAGVQRGRIDDERGARLGRQRQADVLDVFAAIAVRRKGECPAVFLQVAQPDRERENVDLAAGIVDIVFAADVVAAGRHQRRQRRAERRLPAVADVQGARGIGRDEFDHHAFAMTGVVAPVRRALVEDAGEFGLQRAVHQVEVDEAGARYLGPGDHVVGRQRGNDLLGQRARVAARALGMAHRHVARVVAMTRIAGALDVDRQGAQRRRQDVIRERFERRAQQAFERGFQCSSAGFPTGAGVYRNVRRPV